MSKKMLDLAVAQFTGFHHAAGGFNIAELCDAMALTEKEWKAIQSDLQWLTDDQKADVEEYFALQKEAA